MGFNLSDKEFLERAKLSDYGPGKLFVLAGGSASWYSELVGESWPGRIHTTLTSALASCESGRGDTILVLPGTHTSAAGAAVTLSADDVTIRGIPGRGRSTILLGDDAAGQDCLIIDGNNAFLKDLTLQSGSADGNGAAVFLTGAEPGLVIEDCHFTPGTTASRGLELAAGSTEVRVRRCEFKGLVEGVLIHNAAASSLSDCTIQDCVFSECTTALLDAGTQDGFELVMVKDCTFLDCTTYIDLVDIAGGQSNDGMICGCTFDVATNTAALIGDVHAGTIFVSNFTVAGVSVAQPV